MAYIKVNPSYYTILLQERLLATLQPDEVDKILRSFGWSPQDLARGYMIQVKITLQHLPFTIKPHIIQTNGTYIPTKYND